MMTNELLLLAPQIILVVAGMILMLLEPFTAPEQKSRLARIAVLATVVAAFSLMPQWNISPRTILQGNVCRR